ncbi:tail tube GTA-gp10-like protein [Aliiruegeria haliotis]|uniref:Tail tube GTA-gp10-like protein n=1 Tax=Aliiruegeria haliotis TaxID=1280846 RepID=A0A2T0RYH6_9RHOB|nr:gene transfer agent family protein [Aliiruegeria haliotis]PRY26217.1 tail tube GTA-gp10-like protein [Aliiruegeria haliotis]
MGNPWAGEVRLDLNGESRACKLTLGALAELEAGMEGGTVIDLVERFETGRNGVQDIFALILAGLRGGGWTGTAQDLLTADIAGGPAGAARAAAQLLQVAFELPRSGE